MALRIAIRQKAVRNSDRSSHSQRGKPHLKPICRLQPGGGTHTHGLRAKITIDLLPACHWSRKGIRRSASRNPLTPCLEAA